MNNIMRRSIVSSTSQYEANERIRRVALSYGATTVFSVLSDTVFPAWMDRHAIGHTAGEVLYEQKGIGALVRCPEAFQNSCSHAIVIKSITGGGMDAVDKLISTCLRMGTDDVSLGRCFHGLGHGVLAVSGYDVSRVMRICQNGSSKGIRLLFRECIGGVFMELLSEEKHDPAKFAAATEKILSHADGLYPCTEHELSASERLDCFHYLPMVLLGRAAGFGRVWHLDRSTYAAAMEVCLTALSGEERDECFSGFGTQFLASGIREDRKMIVKSDENKFEWIVSMCSLVDNKTSASSCINGAVSSILWGTGRLKPADKVAIDFCASVSNRALADSCFDSLIRLYFDRMKSVDPTAWCAQLPSIHTENCIASGATLTRGIKQ